MAFVHKSHQLFYLAVATAIIASAVVIATAHLPQKQLQTSNASFPIHESPTPSDLYQMHMEDGY
jgi:hypothetical protein